jgi:hypothetical protein
VVEVVLPIIHQQQVEQEVLVVAVRVRFEMQAEHLQHLALVVVVAQVVRQVQQVVQVVQASSSFLYPQHNHP